MSTTISEIYNYIDSFAPFRTQDGFDNSGLCVGDINDSREIKKILVCLDATVSAVKQAKEVGADLIVTHHPVIFHAMKHIDTTQPYGLALYYDIPCIGVHTCLDSAEYGISEMMIDSLGFKSLKTVPYINRTDPVTGAKIGYGALCECGETSAEELASYVAKVFDSAALRYVDGGKKITKIACGSGACSEILEDSHRLGAQAVICADVKLDRFIEADRLGMTLIDAGHYETEAIALPYLKSKLEERFGVDCVISSADRVVRGLNRS